MLKKLKASWGRVVHNYFEKLMKSNSGLNIFFDCETTTIGEIIYTYIKF